MECMGHQNMADETQKTVLYNADNCPCLNVNCDLYKKCDECIKRHHSSSKYPLTACEICQKDGCEKVNPEKYQRDK